MQKLSSEGPPPKTLDQLVRLLADIRCGRAHVALGKRAVGALGRFLDTPRKTAVHSISELASAAGVNASTVTRLAKRLGYRGFSDFQAVFRQHVAQSGHFYSDRAGRLLDSTLGTRSGTPLLERITEDEITNVRTMLENLDPEAFKHAVSTLAGARRVRIHGMRQMFSIACFISYALGMLRSDVAVLGAPEHGVGHALAQLSEEDLLVVVGCAPYTHTTVEVCRFAAMHEFPIIALTDSHASPLAWHASHSFVAPIDSAFFSSSLAAIVVFAECLLSGVARELGEEAVKALERREAFIRELSVEY